MTLQVERALKSKGRLSLLAECAQQLKLNLVEQQARALLPAGEVVTDVDRGRALWKVLKEAIARLKPAAGEPDFTPEWRLYRIAYEVYVQGHTNGEVAKALGLPSRTFDRERRATVETIAQVVWQLEEARQSLNLDS